MKALLHRVLRALQNPRYALARLLWLTGLCRFFKIRLPDGSLLRFHPSSIACALWTDPCFRQEETHFLLGYLRPGDTFVDVGANVGHLSIMASRAVGPAGRVHAVEPHPRVFRFLRDNVALNRASNLEAHNLALGDTPGTVYFTDLPADDMNRISQTGTMPVQLITLDELTRDEEISLLKIDAEGFELPILRGAPGTLTRTRCLVLETSQWQFTNYGYTKQELLDRIQSAGLRVVVPRGRELTAPCFDQDGPELWFGYHPNDEETFARLRNLVQSGVLQTASR